MRLPWNVSIVPRDGHAELSIAFSSYDAPAPHRLAMPVRRAIARTRQWLLGQQHAVERADGGERPGLRARRDPRPDEAREVRPHLGPGDVPPGGDPHPVQRGEVRPDVAPVRLDAVRGQPLLHAEVGEVQVEDGLAAFEPAQTFDGASGRAFFLTKTLRKSRNVSSARMPGSSQSSKTKSGCIFSA